MCDFTVFKYAHIYAQWFQLGLINPVHCDQRVKIDVCYALARFKGTH